MEGLKRQYWSSAQAFDDIQSQESEYEPEKVVVKSGFTPAKQVPEQVGQQPEPQQTTDQPNEIDEF
jgi:hypothetical protein